MGNEFKKVFIRSMGFYALRIFTVISAAIPLKINYFIGRFMGKIGYICSGRHRKVAMENLAVAFPEKSVEYRKNIVRKFFIFMAQGSLELIHVLSHPAYFMNTRIEGRANLDAALANKKGVLLVTAHLGNFPLMMSKLASEGYPINIVARPMRDAKAGDHLFRMREEANVKTISALPRKDCVNGIIKALRDNELVVILMDHNFGTSGVWVKFFGKLAATPTGPITLAIRTGAALVPAYICREGNAAHCVRIMPAQELVIKPDKDETILVNVIKFTRLIEGWIRQSPEQWGWNHRRWKSQPEPEDFERTFQVEKD